MENTKKKKFKIMKYKRIAGHKEFILEEINGYPIFYHGYDFIAYKSKNQWNICDTQCGLKVACDEKSMKKAIENLKSVFDNFMNAIKKQEYKLLCGVYKELLNT